MLFKRVSRSVLFILLGILALRFFFFSPGRGPEKGRPFILRVRLTPARSSVTMDAEKGLGIVDPLTGRLLSRVSRRGGDIPVKSSAAGGAEIAGRRFDLPCVRVFPLKGDVTEIDGKPYRGSVDITVKDGRLSLTNRVELEDYLKGVLPGEVSAFWPFEMLKAQAIASRSYAVHEALRRRAQDYDLTDNTFSQVYGGAGAEKARTTMAVEATGSDILEFAGEVFPAYFHSCCGGHTEDAERVWGLSIRPLEGVECPWCRWSPYFRWRAKIRSKKLAERLNAHGYPLGRIENIETGPRDRSGRVSYVRLRSEGNWFRTPVEEFRDMAGKRELRSSNLSVRRYPSYFLFSGYGWGHGVGMCQWGAFGLSLLKWKRAGGILAHYYPGTEIKRLSDVLKEEDVGFSER